MSCDAGRALSRPDAGAASAAVCSAGDLLYRRHCGFGRLARVQEAQQSAHCHYATDTVAGGCHHRGGTQGHALRQGGYDRQDGGQTGGFRANIRDAAKQQQLADANAIVQSEETEARIKATLPEVGLGASSNFPSAPAAGTPR